MIALSRLNFNWQIKRGEAIYSILASKFEAEAAEGVGKSTVFMAFKSTDLPTHTVPGMVGDDLKKVRKQWEELAKFPSGFADELAKNIAGTERNGGRLIEDDPLRGFRDSDGRPEDGK